MKPALLLAIGVGLSIAMGALHARRLDHIPAWRTLLILLCASVAALLGGHILALAMDTEWASLGWETILTPWKGIRAPGAAIAAAITVPIFCRRFNVSLAHLTDSTVPAGGIAVVLARLGCYLNGCCLPLASWYIAAGVLMFIVGFVAAYHRRYPGQAALISLMIYAVAGAILEPFRYGAIMWGPLPALEWASLALAVFSMAWLIIAEVRIRPDQRSEFARPRSIFSAR